MKHEDIPKLLESTQGQKNTFLPRQQPSGTISEGSALAGFLATAPTAPGASSKEPYDDSKDEWARLLEKWSKCVGWDGEVANLPSPGIDLNETIDLTGRVLVENDLGDMWYAPAGHDRGVEEKKSYISPGINVVEIDECEEVSDMLTELLSAIEALVTNDPSAYGKLMKSFDTPPKEDWLCGSETKYDVLAHLDPQEVMMAEEIVAYIGGQPYLIKSRTDEGVICFLPTKPDLVVAYYNYAFRGKIIVTKTLELK